MAYRIYSFDSLVLGKTYATDDLGTGDAYTGNLFSLPGGAIYDGYGTDTAPVQIGKLTTNYRMVGTSAANLVSQMDALNAKLGVYGTLVIKRDDGAADRAAKARLTKIDLVRKPVNKLYLDLVVEFLVLDPHWCGVARSLTYTSTGSILDQTNLTQTGNVPATNVVMTLTRTAGTPANFLIYLGAVVGSRCNLSWASSLASGSLVISNIARSVLKNGANAYSYFSLLSSHENNNWLEVLPGSVSDLYIECPGGDVQVNVAFDDAWR